MIVTIDGPAGTGKSTAARALAERLQFQFLDTGAMYRAVAVKCLKSGCDLADSDAATRIAEPLRIAFVDGRTHVNGDDLTDQLRSPEATRAASIVAQVPGVRQALVLAQRELAQGRNIVCEGRDQGTVVFPLAECKFYITAAPEIRAERRRQELLAAGQFVAFESLLAEQEQRDDRDRNRHLSPLRPAEDAIVVDTTDLDATTVVDQLESHVRARMPRVRLPTHD